MARVVWRGVPGSGMPQWQRVLSYPRLLRIVHYVKQLPALDTGAELPPQDTQARKAQGWVSQRLGTLHPGASLVRPFSLQGMYPIRIAGQPAAVAYILVVPSPYAVVTGPGGSYRLPPAAPGRYELVVWNPAVPSRLTSSTCAPICGSTCVCLDVRRTGAGPARTTPMMHANLSPAIRGTTLLTALLLASASIAATRPSGGGNGGARTAAGRKLYHAKCAVCHKDDGAGHSYLGPKANLRSPAVQRQTDAQLIAVIKSGNPPMPAWDGILTTEQIQSVVRFIRTFNTLAKK